MNVALMCFTSNYFIFQIITEFRLLLNIETMSLQIAAVVFVCKS